jgi:hypothetical protein
MCLNISDSYGMCFIYQKSHYHITYGHRYRKIRDPVRSPIVKPVIAGLVVGSVTTSEYLVLYVFALFASFFSTSPATLCALD